MEIKDKRILPVSAWNQEYKRKGNYVMVYTLGNGSMLDTERKRGYVVQKHHVQGGERSRFHRNYELALSDYNSDNF